MKQKSKPPIVLLLLLSIIAIALQTLAFWGTKELFGAIKFRIDQEEEPYDNGTDNTANDKQESEDASNNIADENQSSEQDTGENTEDDNITDGDGTDEGDDTEPEPESEPETKPDPPPEPEIILCLGDSVTNGYPYAGTSSTYPARLQTLIDSGYGGSKYSVVNKGVNGATADYVRDHTAIWLDQYDPEIVLLMVGGNDLATVTPENPSEYVPVVIQTVSEVQQTVNIIKAHTNPDGGKPKVVLSAFTPNQLYAPLGALGIKYYNEGWPGQFSGLSNISSKDKWFTSNFYDLYDATTGAKESLMYDDVHPNASGYSAIANNWFSTISSYLD